VHDVLTCKNVPNKFKVLPASSNEGHPCRHPVSSALSHHAATQGSVYLPALTMGTWIHLELSLPTSSRSSGTYSPSRKIKSPCSLFPRAGTLSPTGICYSHLAPSQPQFLLGSGSCLDRC